MKHVLIGQRNPLCLATRETAQLVLSTDQECPVSCADFKNSEEIAEGALGKLTAHNSAYRRNADNFGRREGETDFHGKT